MAPLIVPTRRVMGNAEAQFNLHRERPRLMGRQYDGRNGSFVLGWE